MPIKTILTGMILVFFLSGGCRSDSLHPGQTDTGIKPNDPPRKTTDSLSAMAADPINDGKENRLECYGTLVIPASEIIQITPAAGGILKSIFYASGTYVNEGALLATIESVDLIKLQEEYLETKSHFYYFSEELRRQGELTIENASSVKKLQQAQLDYQTSEIKLHSLAKQLALIGLNADSIDVDRISSQIPILAPVSGYIDKISFREGNHIAPGETLFVIIRDYQPVIMIEIPERYFNMVKTGQTLDFFLPADSLVSHKARLTYISKRIDLSNHMIRARAFPSERSHHFIPGMRVKIWLNTY